MSTPVKVPLCFQSNFLPLCLGWQQGMAQMLEILILTWKPWLLPGLHVSFRTILGVTSRCTVPLCPACSFLFCSGFQVNESMTTYCQVSELKLHARQTCSRKRASSYRDKQPKVICTYYSTIKYFLRCLFCSHISYWLVFFQASRRLITRMIEPCLKKKTLSTGHKCQ